MSTPETEAYEGALPPEETQEDTVTETVTPFEPTPDTLPVVIPTEPLATTPEAVPISAGLDADCKRIETMAREEHAKGRSNVLEYGKTITKRLRADIATFAKGAESIPAIRSNVVARFAKALSDGYARKYDEKEIYRIIKAHQLAEMVDAPTRANLDRIAWDTVRVLTRWVHWNEREDEYSLSFSVSVGVEDPVSRLTTRTVDATPLLTSLIAALAASPKSASVVRGILDTRQGEARDAEIAFLTSKQQRKAHEIRSREQQQERNKEVNGYFQQIATRLNKYGLSNADVLQRLYDANIIPPPDEDSFNPAVMSEDTANSLCAALCAADNVEAIAMLAKRCNAYLMEHGRSQPSKAAGTQLGFNRTIDPPVLADVA